MKRAVHCIHEREALAFCWLVSEFVCGGFVSTWNVGAGGASHGVGCHHAALPCRGFVQCMSAAVYDGGCFAPPHLARARGMNGREECAAAADGERCRCDGDGEELLALTETRGRHGVLQPGRLPFSWPANGLLGQ